MANADRLIEIFDEAKERTAGAERDRFLAEACPDDPELKEQVVSLLQSYEGVGDFLKNTMFSPTVLVTEKPGDVIGRYKLLEKLGEGGCGVVYVAEQTEPVRRRVALKVIKLGMDTKQVIARFEAERQALAMMDHPNIAKVLDAGATATGRSYFVMEVVRGIRITDYCDHNNLSTKERLDLFVKVCQAIQHAHQKGIIHRDIKPSNILVTLHDGVPVPKVIDFGIAKATEGRLTDATVYTQLHQFIGTPAYMSPEQAEMSGLDIDTRSDIYSLGVLLYELLTGKTPFDAQRLMAAGLDAMRKTIRETEPVRPSTRLTEEFAEIDRTPRKAATGLAIPSESEAAAESRAKLRLKEQINRVRGDLDWIVMKCLEKDRSRRYDTANGLAADLSRHLNNEPVIARPPSAAYKFQKALRRNKLAFTAAATVAIALFAGIGVSTWQAFKAGRAMDLAETERDKARNSQKAENEARQEAEYHLYVANINRAGQAWEHNNIEQLRRLLAATRSFPHRGFEWYYWQRQAHLNLTTMRGHISWINSVAFSPDGRRIVTSSEDRTARVWDVATGQQLFMLLGHTNGLNSAAFSPDGKLIATGSDDQTVRVWDATTGREVFKHVGHEKGVTCVAFSPDSLRIVSTSYDGTARIWEATGGREALIFRGHMTNIYSAAYSRNGKSIVTGGDDRTARIWDANIGREIIKLEGHLKSIRSVAFSPDGLRVLTGSTDFSARVWDATTRSNLLTLMARGPVGGVGFSPDGKRVVTGSWDSLANVWDAVSGDKLLIIGADAMSVMAVAFSPDGDRIVTSGGEGVAKVWEASDERQSIVLRGCASPVLAVALSPDGQRIATGGGPFDDLATSGKEVVQIWDSANGKKLFALEGHSAGISSIAYSPDGLSILTGSGDQTARLWSAAAGHETLRFEKHTGVVYSVAFSPDSRRILTGGEDNTARVWDVATGEELLNLDKHAASVRAVAFSPKGQRIATGDWEGTVMIWDAINGAKQRSLVHSHLIRTLGLTFSPDGKRLVACGWPRSAIVWDVETGREIFELRGHLSPVDSPAFSPDGKRIVTTGWDRCAKLWDADTGRELLSLNDTGDSLSGVAFSQDGQRIVTGNWAGTARVWEAARADQVMAWEAEERAAEQSQDRWRKELSDLLQAR